MNVRVSELIRNEVDVQALTFPKWKRGLDLLGSIVGLVLLSPIFITVGLIILITDGRPVLFRQSRVGWQGRPFYIIKFRTMCKNAEQILKNDPMIYKKYVENDYKLPEGEDPRVTKIGSFLRKTSLDEIPQLWNVLKGDMSLVGPRPIVKDELEEYGNKKSLFLRMKPGITGVWQVSGRSELKYPERALLELSYVDKSSITCDIKILLKTVICVCKSKGAY